MVAGVSRDGHAVDALRAAVVSLILISVVDDRDVRAEDTFPGLIEREHGSAIDRPMHPERRAVELVDEKVIDEQLAPRADVDGSRRFTAPDRGSHQKSADPGNASDLVERHARRSPGCTPSVHLQAATGAGRRSWRATDAAYRARPMPRELTASTRSSRL